jgi:hypothetical protein
LLLSGCIALPSNVTRPIPDLTPHVPAEWLSGNEPVLVLIQTAATNRRAFFTFSMTEYKTWDTRSVVTARILKGAELKALKDSMVQSSQRSVLLLLCSGFNCGSGDIEGGREQMQVLCMISTRGDEIALRPQAKTWDAAKPSAIHTARRDALVAALRADAARPFERIDGPCGIAGELEIPKEMQQQLLAMISAMPDRTPLPLQSPFDAVAAKAASGQTTDGKTMVVSAARWREETIVSDPLFLDGNDFTEFEKAFQTGTAAELTPFFPQHIAAHAAGTRARDNLKIDYFCVINSSGDVLFWGTDSKAWRKVEERPPYRSWKANAVKILKGDEAPDTFRESCMPAANATWPAATLSRAIAFIEGLPSQDEPHSAANVMAAMLAPVGIANPAMASALVLVAATNPEGGHAVIPYFLWKDENVSAVLRTIVSIAPDGFLRALPGTPELNRSGAAQKFCLIAPSGTVTTVARAAGKDEWLAAQTNDSWLNAQLVNREVRTPLAAADNYAAVCKIARPDWKGETLEKVAAYAIRNSTTRVEKTAAPEK